MNKQMKRLGLAVSLLLASAGANAGIILSKVDHVSTADGWILGNAAGNGVDFWIMDVASLSDVVLAVSADILFGMSVYEGDAFPALGFFDPNGDIGGNAFVGGLSAYVPPSVQELGLRLQAGTYTVAVGGADFGFEPSYAYELTAVATAVPEPGTVALLGLGVLAVLLTRRSRTPRLV